MKIKFNILTILIIVLIITVIIFCLRAKTQRTDEKEMVNSFDILDYTWEVKNCGYEKNVGSITTKNIAIDKAKQLWKERFGNLYVDNILPIAVAYDKKCKCWRVNGTLQDNNVDGAVPCGIISKDGDVLALWIG